MVAGWYAARVVDVVDASEHARLLALDVPGWPGSAAGQHVDIRLTAEDGYQAVRSYSLGSYGEGERIELGVDEVPDGEVSPYLVRDVRAGDELEVKGPLGGYFVWRPGGAGRVQLIAGGSGIVPLMSIARAARDAAAIEDFRMLYSVRSSEDAIYRDELDDGATRGGVAVDWAYTRAAPPEWGGKVGRLDDDTLERLVWPVAESPTFYVCGPTGFVEFVADSLVHLGHPAARIKTERFGGA